MTSIVLTTLGLVIILVTLRDIVHELFHPERSGSISAAIMRANWWLMRRLARHRREFLYDAGPLMLIAVAGAWTALLTVGWAIIYAPRLPGAFHVSSGVPTSSTHGAWTAFYISLSTLGTMGSSDFAPDAHFLRALFPMEALVGAVMVTAWISWVLSIYPVLATRRTLTRGVLVFRQAYPSPAAAIGEQPRDALLDALRAFTVQTLRVGAELQQSRVTYYFQDREADRNIACQFPYMLALARSATDAADPAVRHAGDMLCRAVDQVLVGIGRDFLRTDATELPVLLARLRADQLLEDDAGCSSS